MHRLLAATVLASALSLYAADAASEKQVIDVVQKTFDAMAAKDADAIRKLFVPDARLIATHNGKLTSTPVEQFATRISAIPEPILERIWNPKVLVQGDIAILWAEFDFHRASKLSHCGIDVVNLLKTEDGWKIASIQFTVQTTGCTPSPLGPPKP